MASRLPPAPLSLALSLSLILGACDSPPKERIYPPMQAVAEIASVAPNPQRTNDAPAAKADLDRLIGSRWLVVEHLAKGGEDVSREFTVDRLERVLYLPDMTCKIGGGAIGYLSPVFNPEGRMADRLTCPGVNWEYKEEPILIDYRTETKLDDGLLNLKGEWTITRKGDWLGSRSGEIHQKRIEAAFRLTPAGCEVLDFRQEIHTEVGPQGSVSSFMGRGVENTIVQKGPSTRCSLR